jgi:hypothetical protein
MIELIGKPWSYGGGNGHKRNMGSGGEEKVDRTNPGVIEWS